MKIPRYSGAANTIVADKTGLNAWTNAIGVDSIFLYGDEFLVDGFLFLPKSACLGWEF